MAEKPSHTISGATPERSLLARARQAYAQESRQALEEEWILRYLPMVRHIVQKVTRSMAIREDVDDLISAGTLGLVKAARGFDPSRQVEFKTYAYIRVRGAVIDELRDRSFLPAAVHNEIRRLREAYGRHMAERGKPPSDEELAETLKMPLERLYHVLEETRRRNFLSIHGLSDDEPALGRLHLTDGQPSPYQQVERKELLEKMAQAISDLPERDRLVVLLYYDRDLTMKEAAQVLRVTESRFSQLHASAIFKLSMKMGIRT